GKFVVARRSQSIEPVEQLDIRGVPRQISINRHGVTSDLSRLFAIDRDGDSIVVVRWLGRPNSDTLKESAIRNHRVQRSGIEPGKGEAGAGRAASAPRKLERKLLMPVLVFGFDNAAASARAGEVSHLFLWAELYVVSQDPDFPTATSATTTAG